MCQVLIINWLLRYATICFTKFELVDLYSRKLEAEHTYNIGVERERESD